MSAEPYAALVHLAEEELELVRAGRLEDAAAVQARRDEHVAALPARPPAEAGPALERAAALQREITVTLATGLRSAIEALRKVDRGRAAARSYAPAGAEVPGTLDRSA